MKNMINKRREQIKQMALQMFNELVDSSSAHINDLTDNEYAYLWFQLAKIAQEEGFAFMIINDSDYEYDT